MTSMRPFTLSLLTFKININVVKPVTLTEMHIVASRDRREGFLEKRTESGERLGMRRQVQRIRKDNAQNIWNLKNSPCDTPDTNNNTCPSGSKFCDGCHGSMRFREFSYGRTGFPRRSSGCIQYCNIRSCTSGTVNHGYEWSFNVIQRNNHADGIFHERYHRWIEFNDEHYFLTKIEIIQKGLKKRWGL